MGEVTPAEAPVLSLDAAMLLVEAAVRHAGTSAGATREEVRAAGLTPTSAYTAVHLIPAIGAGRDA